MSLTDYGIVALVSVAAAFVASVVMNLVSSRLRKRRDAEGGRPVVATPVEAVLSEAEEMLRSHARVRRRFEARYAAAGWDRLTRTPPTKEGLFVVWNEAAHTESSEIGLDLLRTGLISPEVEAVLRRFRIVVVRRRDVVDPDHGAPERA